MFYAFTPFACDIRVKVHDEGISHELHIDK